MIPTIFKLIIDHIIRKDDDGNSKVHKGAAADYLAIGWTGGWFILVLLKTLFGLDIDPDIFEVFQDGAGVAMTYYFGNQALRKIKNS